MDLKFSIFYIEFFCLNFILLYGIISSLFEGEIMNKGYTCYGKYAYIYLGDGSKIIREYENNFSEVLIIENIIEMLEKKIENDTNEREKNMRKRNYLRYSAGKGAWALYLLVFLYFLAMIGPVFALSFIIGVKILISFNKGKIVKYDKKIKGLNYELLKERKLLKESKNNLEQLKKEKDVKTIYNDYVDIDNSDELSKIERRMELAYLYKLKEDIIKENLIDNNLDKLFDGDIFLDDKLDDFSKEVLKEYILEKRKVLTKD